MKGFSLSIISLMILLGFNGCGDESNTVDSQTKGADKVFSSQKNKIDYESLPVKENLKYFEDIDNLMGYLAYKDANKNFKVTKSKAYLGLFSVKIKNNDISEFEYDDFINNLKVELSKNVAKIKKTYESKNIPTHIRITNLAIPVSFDINGRVTIPSESRKKYLKPLGGLYVDHTRKKIAESLLGDKNEKYFSIYNNKCVYGTQLMLNDSSHDNRREQLSVQLSIKADKELIKTIGKANKGKDIITELTVKLDEIDEVGSNSCGKAEFYISSFKLKNSKTRFTTKGLYSFYTPLKD